MEENTKAVRIIDNNVVKLDEIREAVDYKADARFRKIDDRTASQISGLLQYVPQMAETNKLSGTFRVEFPKGISGYLVEHENGFLSTMKDADTGKIVGHATFVPTEESIPIALGMFTALSVVTSQYFLAQINQKLEEVRQKLDQILDFLYNDKECEIYAESQNVRSIYANYPSIMRSSVQRIASITAIQHAKVVAEKNIQFYYRDMNQRVKKKLGDKGLPLPELPDFVGKLTDDKMKSLAYQLLDDLSFYNQSINLYCICSIMEILLSQNFTDSYLNFVETEFSNHFRTHNILIGKLNGEISVLTKKQKSGHSLRSVMRKIQDLLGEESPENKYQDVINQIRKTYNTKTEFRLLKDGTVYQKIH